jgi:sulfur-oxidizing protein SoxX
MMRRCLLLAAALVANGSPAAAQAALVPYDVVDDAIPKPLTLMPGDPVNGRALVVKRETTCLLCHSGPFPDQRFQGNLSPPLTGTGSRWTEGELRLRMVDATRLNEATIMPSFYRIDGLNRVAKNLRGKPILTAQEVEDVVAFLITLKDGANDRPRDRAKDAR